jgi:putative endonuclease
MSPSGSAAEALAASLLAEAGLEIIVRNYRCRHGEIDIIARDGDTVVFVEVRSRGGDAYGGAAESITPAKRDRLLKTARHYLARLGRLPSCRFDAVLITARPPRREWLRDVISE